MQFWQSEKRVRDREDLPLYNVKINAAGLKDRAVADALIAEAEALAAEAVRLEAEVLQIVESKIG